MKTPEQERLLADVLHDESYMAFRAELRERMLKNVRARRRQRWVKPLLAMAACITMALTALWLQQSRAPVVAPVSSVVTVLTAPLRPDQIVTTAGAMLNVAVVRSRAPESLSVVSTVALPVEGLSDDELLELFRGRAVVLVGTGSARRLMFLDEQSAGSDEISQ
jgi:hypothetical protein